MRQLFKAFAVVLVAFGLAGCGSNFDTDADLSTVTPRVYPLVEGKYAGNGDGFGTFTRLEDGHYELSAVDDTNITFTLFGPVDGLYVAQIDRMADDPPGARYQNIIVRVGPQGQVALADAEPVKAALGAMLFEDLRLPAASRPKVGLLTDNAALNWAIIQRLIVRNAAQFTFMDELTPVR